ncbi:hypothetical protein K432DRAFT_450053 [Lepidopterella palustris CBS 459.81]|uniref:NACHT domain-containing protein n=1 Tax=Lepidopterella palustris CBS 459.81 TaxID=1314670 RepID=A0A8E2DWY4_9PEZI|nr:hypothetical protein K432DRAFT_450053 [Lepidopterella palustris CBS 459.81]
MEPTISNDITSADSKPHTFLFPAPNSAWSGPDPLPLRSRILNSFQNVFNIDIPTHHKAGFIPHESGNVYNFLAYEALNAHSETSPSQDMDFMGVLAFKRLHHLNLHGYEVELELELHKLCESETTSKKQLDHVKILLRDYCQAIRDYQYVCQHHFKPHWPNKLYPFHETLLPTLNTRLNSDPTCPVYQNAWQDNLYRGIDTPYLKWQDGVISKIWGGMFGGLVLIVPMLIMTLHSTIKTSLITSSLFIIGVAFGLVFLSQGTWQDVLGMTAAYAAVLVVFVGTSIAGRVERLPKTPYISRNIFLDQAIIEYCQRRILQRIWYRTIDDRRVDVKEAHSSTFKWALEPQGEGVEWDDFPQWLQSGSGIYWVSGKAGDGKSTLMKYLWSELQTKKFLKKWAAECPLILASFFLWNLGTTEQSHWMMWREARGSDERPTLHSPAEMREAFNMIGGGRVGTRKFCIFIDGLDEYAGNYVDGVAFVRTLVANPNVKIVVSSRPVPA